MKFNSIKTQRLVIRSLCLEDAKTMSDYRSVPAVSKYQSWESYTEEEASDLVSDMMKSHPTNKGTWFQFGIELNENKKLIGDVGFLNEDNDGRSWVGFTLDLNYWSHGHAYEAVSAILTYYLGIERLDIWASTDPLNTASQKLLMKLGFILRESKPDDLLFQLVT